MVLRDDGLICPYCGSVETEERRERDDDHVYGCVECNRTFSAPQ
jgi:DNA-directed RNA polymerase subunit RPC12/RpoP